MLGWSWRHRLFHRIWILVQTNTPRVLSSFGRAFLPCTTLKYLLQPQSRHRTLDSRRTLLDGKTLRYTWNISWGFSGYVTSMGRTTRKKVEFQNVYGCISVLRPIPGLKHNTRRSQTSPRSSYSGVPTTPTPPGRGVSWPYVVSNTSGNVTTYSLTYGTDYTKRPSFHHCGRSSSCLGALLQRIN